MGNGTGCPPFHLNAPDCDITYADNLGTPFLVAHIIYCAAVFFGLIFVAVHAYRTLKVKGFNLFQSVQVRLHMIMITGILLLVSRMVDPFGWKATLPFQVICLTYDLNGVMTISIGFDIIFDWLRVVQLARGKLMLSSKLRYMCIGMQISTLVILMFFSLLQCLVGPWWLFHSIKIACYILIAGTICLLFYYYGFRVRNIIRAAEKIRDENRKYYLLAQQQATMTRNLQSSQNGYSIGPYTTTTSITIPQPNSKSSISQHNTGFSPQYNGNLFTSPSQPGTYHMPSSISQNYLPTGNTYSHTHTTTHTSTNTFTYEPPQHTSNNNNNNNHTPDFSHSSSHQNDIESAQQHSNNVQKKASAAAKVPRLIVFIISILLTSICLWSFVLYDEIMKKCTFTDSCDLQRHGIVSLLLASMYDVIHLTAYICICIFFSVKLPPTKDTNKGNIPRGTNSVQRRLTGGSSYVILDQNTPENSISQSQHLMGRNDNVGSATQHSSLLQHSPDSSHSKPLGSQPNQQRGSYTVRSLFPKSTLYGSYKGGSSKQTTTSYLPHDGTHINPTHITTTTANNTVPYDLQQQYTQNDLNDQNLNNQQFQQHPVLQNTQIPEHIHRTGGSLVDPPHIVDQVHDLFTQIINQSQNQTSANDVYINTQQNNHQQMNDFNNTQNIAFIDPRSSKQKLPSSSFYGPQSSLEQQNLYQQQSQQHQHQPLRTQHQQQQIHQHDPNIYENIPSAGGYENTQPSPLSHQPDLPRHQTSNGKKFNIVDIDEGTQTDFGFSSNFS